MFDDLRNDKSKKDKESDKTQPTWSTARIEPNPFDQILRTANFGFDRTDNGLLENDEIKLLGPKDLIDWPFFGDKGAVNCNKAVLTPKYLKAVDLPIRDGLVKSARSSAPEKFADELPDWMKNLDTSKPAWLDDEELFTRNGLPKDEEVKIPEWLDDDELFAQKGLPKAGRNTIPAWMKELDQSKTGQPDVVQLFAKKGLPKKVEEKKAFDPNETQKVKAYKKPKNVLGALLGIGAYIIVVNIAGTFFIGNFDDLAFDIIGVVFYYYMFNQGYEFKFLLPRKK